tara:strand:- start:339 stop:746 length:408 start_codon:yes stop_codon:yes gene_type:complete
MKEQFSKIDSDKLLYVINLKKDISKDRKDLSPETEYLQVSCKKLAKNDSFRPHRHLFLQRNTLTTHESWVIIKGRIKAKLFDIDNSFYSEEILSEGDCLVCFNAGHCFEVLEDDTLLYEFKNGPYYGVERDKEFI